MRDLKFRAWDKRTRKMVETGFHMLGEVSCFNLLYSYGMKHGLRKNEVGLLRMNSFVLMQYTGLKDKNGTECYWDDWVTDGINPKFLVTPDYHLLARLSEIEFEIVGNKYED